MYYFLSPFYFILFFIKHRVSPYSPGHARTHCVDWTGLKLTEISASVSSNAGIKGVHHHTWFFYTKKKKTYFLIFYFLCISITCRYVFMAGTYKRPDPLELDSMCVLDTKS